jgi:hypothetical protein
MEDIFVHNVGDGSKTIFWHHKWCVHGTLADAFPRLHRISFQSDANIINISVWESGTWI